MDSHLDPLEIGTYDELDDILAALLTDAYRNNCAIGDKNLSPSKLINQLRCRLACSFPKPSCREPSRNLDEYIEAQIHGDLSLQDDVDARVIGDADMELRSDPSKWMDRGSDKEVLQELKLLLWHVLVRYGEPML